MNKGFTLIELLIILAMMATLSSLLFFDYDISSKLFSLERSSQKIAQDIRKAQQKALIGLEGDVNTNGYGLYFSLANKGNYIIYENNNTTPFYDSGDMVIEIIEIPEGIEIESLKSNGSSVETLSVSFFPPGPITYIQNNFLNAEGLITLNIVEKEEKRIVRINSSGGSEIIKP